MERKENKKERDVLLLFSAKQSLKLNYGVARARKSYQRQHTSHTQSNKIHKVIKAFF